jgi:hypothetical protein
MFIDALSAGSPRPYVLAMASLDESEIGYSSEYLADISALAEELVRAGATPDALAIYEEAAAEPLDGGADIRSTVEVDFDTTDIRQIADLERLIAFAFDTAVVVVHGADEEQDARFSAERISGILAEYSVTLHLVETSIGSWHGVIEIVARRTEQALKYVALAGAVLGVLGATVPVVGVPLQVIGAVLSGVPALAAVIPGLDGVRFRGETIRVPSSAATVKLKSEFLYHYVLECEPGTDDRAIREVRDHLVISAEALGIDRRSFQTTRTKDAGDGPKHFQFTTAARLTTEQVDTVEGYLRTSGVRFDWIQRPGPPPATSPPADLPWNIDPNDGWAQADWLVSDDETSPPQTNPASKSTPPAKPANDKELSAGG